ncbi:hypothetical protein BJY04DRAFT_188531, partial [Aspergillus karnatakaensis]|uniref:fungal specific transcription factor domain-containing protein n=1 Tax=Aspergillus karnatakaensis TaxID=1810916 RepID=UPI003CCDAD4A
MGRGLICAICAVGVKFSGHPNRRDLEVQLTTEAKRLLKADLENGGLENLQTCILLSTLSAGNCETSSEALYVRIATSMAEILHLHTSTIGGSIIARKTAARIWWSLYIADRWCFSGLGIPRHMDDVGGFLRLPLDEDTFRSLPPDQNIPNVPYKQGLWAYMITLVRLFGPIQGLNRRFAFGDTDITELDQTVVNLGQKLETWNGMLPVEIQFTIANLHSHQHNGLGGPFIALHLAYHHYSTLLYFRFLED